METLVVKANGVDSIRYRGIDYVASQYKELRFELALGPDGAPNRLGVLIDQLTQGEPGGCCRGPEQ